MQTAGVIYFTFLTNLINFQRNALHLSTVEIGTCSNCSYVHERRQQVDALARIVIVLNVNHIDLNVLNNYVPGQWFPHITVSDLVRRSIDGEQMANQDWNCPVCNHHHPDIKIRLEVEAISPQLILCIHRFNQVFVHGQYDRDIKLIYPVDIDEELHINCNGTRYIYDLHGISVSNSFFVSIFIRNIMAHPFIMDITLPILELAIIT